MARKSKRMVLNEAIRQGQAKIAEGLKTGQMRSGSPSSQTGTRDKEQNFDVVVPGRAGFLTSKDKSTMDRVLSSRAKLILLSAFAVLVLGIGLTASLMKSTPDAVPDKPVEESPINEIAAPEKTVPIREQDQADNKSKTIVPAPMPVPATPQGGNVIWITSIEVDRQKELVPPRDFFNRKGIPTEIIGVGNLAALVTKAGFERNPAAKGTEGYGLLQQIKKLGLIYVQETEDTKFGVKPFQDAYGYKR
ncbi:MAG: hypothetical protein OEV87_09515 [Phycisphaerae bacterium]|nr:hypothetical protein [Phycisphaerae bacterium]